MAALVFLPFVCFFFFSRASHLIEKSGNRPQPLGGWWWLGWWVRGQTAGKPCHTTPHHTHTVGGILLRRCVNYTWVLLQPRRGHSLCYWLGGIVRRFLTFHGFVAISAGKMKHFARKCNFDRWWWIIRQAACVLSWEKANKLEQLLKFRGLEFLKIRNKTSEVTSQYVWDKLLGHLTSEIVVLLIELSMLVLKVPFVL